MKLSGLALLGAASIAAAQNHAHQHRHAARHGSPVERDVASVTEVVPGPVVTVFELNGQDISWEDVQDGLESGKYVIVGDTISTVIPAAPTTTSTTSTSSTPTPTASSSSSAVAEFFEVKSSAVTTSSSTTSAAPTSTHVAATTSSTSVAAKTSSAAASTSSGSGISSEFPSGTISCDTFPSAYGAVYVDWLGLDGWIGIQQVSSYSPGDSSISDIVAAVSGGCTKNSFCSYACPAGYQKSQWPTAQGSTGQSVGGLYCNSEGMLELSRSSESTICIAGAGGVSVTNSLSSTVSVCRTDYPGSESETVPLEVTAGSTEPICNPNALTYYQWEGSYTSAQYYINPSGYGPSEACIWGSSGTNLGNWAPVNMGVGESSTGVTYVSLFPNSPTNPDGVLDFSIKITGDVSGSCSYSGGTYYLNGVESSTGCTVSVTGNAVMEFYSS